MLALSSGRLLGVLSRIYLTLSSGTLTCNLTGWHLGRSVRRTTGVDGLEPPRIPYFSVAPAIHPSMIPSTIPSTAGGSSTVARGVETVGQAQILTEFSKPFQLARLSPRMTRSVARTVTMSDCL